MAIKRDAAAADHKVGGVERGYLMDVITLLRRKLDYLQRELAKAYDSEQKFGLQIRIEETETALLALQDVALQECQENSQEVLLHDEFRWFNLTEIGYTPNDPGNLLVSQSVPNINRTTSAADFDTNPFTGVFADTLIQKGVSPPHVLLHELAVTVHRCEPIPLFWPVGGIGGMASALEASFLICRRSTPLPWVFADSRVRYCTDVLESRRPLPLILSDTEPMRIRFFINGRDPGIYWVSCSALVGRGIEEPSRIEFVPASRPIPLAYYQDERSTDPDAPEEVTVRTALDEVGKALNSVKDGSWIDVPRGSEDQRQSRRRSLEEHERYLTERLRSLGKL